MPLFEAIRRHPRYINLRWTKDWLKISRSQSQMTCHIDITIHHDKQLLSPLTLEVVKICVFFFFLTSQNLCLLSAIRHPLWQDILLLNPQQQAAKPSYEKIVCFTCISFLGRRTTELKLYHLLKYPSNKFQ